MSLGVTIFNYCVRIESFFLNAADAAVRSEIAARKLIIVAVLPHFQIY